MANVSYQEAESNLTGPNKTESTSGSISNISGLIHYRYLFYNKWSTFGQLLFPMVAGSGSYISGGIGMHYDFGRSNSRKILLDQNTRFVISPSTRYYLIGSLNGSYLSYKTETAVKQDTTLEIEAGLGLSKKISKYNFMLQTTMLKGTGVVTSSMAMRILLGGTFYLD